MPLEGDKEVKWWSAMTIEQHVEHYIALISDRKEAMKQVGKDRGMSKRDVYNQIMIKDGE